MNQHSIGFIKKLLVLLLKTDTLNFIGAPEAFIQFGTIAQIAQFNLAKAPPLPGLRDQLSLVAQRPPSCSNTFDDFVSVDLASEGPRSNVEFKSFAPISGGPIVGKRAYLRTRHAYSA